MICLHDERNLSLWGTRPVCKRNLTCLHEEQKRWCTLLRHLCQHVYGCSADGLLILPDHYTTPGQVWWWLVRRNSCTWQCESIPALCVYAWLLVSSGTFCLRHPWLSVVNYISGHIPYLSLTNLGCTMFSCLLVLFQKDTHIYSSHTSLSACEGRLLHSK